MWVPAYHSIQLPFCSKRAIEIPSSGLQLSHSSRVGNSTSRYSAFNFPIGRIQLPIHPFNRSVAFYSRCDHSIDPVQLPIRPITLYDGTRVQFRHLDISSYFEPEIRFDSHNFWTLDRTSVKFGKVQIRTEIQDRTAAPLFLMSTGNGPWQSSSWPSLIVKFGST